MLAGLPQQCHATPKTKEWCTHKAPGASTCPHVYHTIHILKSVFMLQPPFLLLFFVILTPLLQHTTLIKIYCRASGDVASGLDVPRTVGCATRNQYNETGPNWLNPAVINFSFPSHGRAMHPDKKSRFCGGDNSRQKGGSF